MPRGVRSDRATQPRKWPIVEPIHGGWRNRLVPATPIDRAITDSDLREGTKPRRIVVRGRAGLAMALPSLPSDVKSASQLG